jgi:hypothetical protein
MHKKLKFFGFSRKQVVAEPAFSFLPMGMI